MPFSKRLCNISMLFQPICGTNSVGGNFFTTVLNMLRHSVLFSSEKLHINCCPKQMPKTGCVSAGISLSSPFSFKYFIAVLASPTPGKITLSAFLRTSMSSVTTHS